MENKFWAISKRVLLFVATNILIITTISVIITILTQAGILNLGAGYGSLAMLCLIWGMGGAFISLAISRWMAKMAMRVQVIDPHQAAGDAAWLVETVHALARKAGIRKMPEVGVYESGEINAFATGPTKNRALVAVSSGLLQRMNRDEVEGVLGHEVAHISNGDMVTMTLIQGIVNAIVMFLARIIANAIANAGSDERRGTNPFFYFMIVQALQMVLMVLALPIVNGFSRWREYRADAGGALLAGKAKMVGALQALKGTTSLVDEQHESLASLKISGKRKGLMASLFSTHPSLDDRIRRLQES